MHAVEDCAADGYFRLLSLKRPSPQMLPDDALVSSDSDLDQRSFAIAGGELPFHPAVIVYCGDMLVSLDGRFSMGLFDRVGARWNDDGGVGAVVDDLAAIGIHGQMELSPTATGSDAMLLFQPLAGAVDLKSGAVDQNVPRSVGWTLAITLSSGRLPCPCPTAECRMIGVGKRQSHQLQHRSQQPFRLAQPQPEYQAERQSSLDRQIGIAVLAATGFALRRFPRRNRF